MTDIHLLQDCCKQDSRSLGRITLPISVLALGILAAVGTGPAAAGSISINDAYLYYYSVGPNNLGFGNGQFVRYGATNVTPNGAGGTTGVATTTNATTGNTITRTINWVTSPAVPNFYTGTIATCTSNCGAAANNNPANLTNPWTLTFSNPSTTPAVASTSLSLVGSGEIPFVNSVTLSGNGAAPTFSWSPPASVSVEGYRVNIYQNNLETFDANGKVIDSGQVTSHNLAANVTQYTVDSADFVHGVALSPNTQYTIEISAFQTRDGTSNSLTNGNVASLSRVYSNFQILPTGSPAVNLPTTTVQGNQVTYGFNLTVSPGVSYYIDPTIATGYLYQIGSGDPNFASVILPNIGNSGPYSLYLWNGTSFVFDTSLAAGQLFNFGPAGVSEFEVLGIDPSLALDPNNTTAFITQLTFTGVGNFTGTMTPLTEAVGATPLPGALPMFVSAFGSIAGFVRWRRKRKGVLAGSAYA
jgi:hypothetical protein